MCKWLKNHVNRFKKRATAKLLFVFGFNKFLAGLGIGMLLVTYWPTVRWNPVGWGALAIGMILGIYGAWVVFRK